MRQRRTLLIATIMALVLVVCWLLFSGPGEPTIQGVGLRRWAALQNSSELEKGLAQIGPGAIPWLIKGTQAEDSIFFKGKLALWKKLSPGLRSKLRNYQPVEARQVRSQCTSALKRFGPEARQAVPQLIKLARKDSDSFVRNVAVFALGEIATDSPEALSALLAFLKDNDALLRSWVASALYFSELCPIEALPALLAQLEHYERGPFPSDKPLNEMLAISRYGPEAEAAGSLLVQYITRGEGRGNVLNALKAIGPGAVPAMPRLLELLEAGPPAAGEAEISTMKPLIFSVFKSIGPAATPALPALTNGLRDANGVVRAVAAAGIGNVAGDYEFAVPLLIKELENRRFGNDDASLSFVRRNLSLGLNQRQTAAMLLGEIGPAASNALPNLIRALKSGDSWLPPLAAEAIWKISGDAQAILPCLIDSLKNSDEARRLLALRILSQMGPAAQPALPAIRETTNTDMKMRREAVEALRRVQR